MIYYIAELSLSRTGLHIYGVVNHTIICRNISPFGEDTRLGEYAKHKFQKIRRLISASAECCEVITTRRS